MNVLTSATLRLALGYFASFPVPLITGHEFAPRELGDGRGAYFLTHCHFCSLNESGDSFLFADAKSCLSLQTTHHYRCLHVETDGQPVRERHLSHYYLGCLLA